MTTTPPQLPDTTNWIKRQPGDVIEKGTRVAIYWPDRDEWAVQTMTGRRVLNESHAFHFTPPPADPEPWEALSTDPEKPTLARVTYTARRIDTTYDATFMGNAYVGDSFLMAWDGETSIYVTETKHITSVELLHTYNPDTHLVVNRDLIGDLANWYGRDRGSISQIVNDILLDAAQNGADL